MCVHVQVHVGLGPGLLRVCLFARLLARSLACLLAWPARFNKHFTTSAL